MVFAFNRMPKFAGEGLDAHLEDDLRVKNVKVRLSEMSREI